MRKNPKAAGATDTTNRRPLRTVMSRLAARPRTGQWFDPAAAHEETERARTRAAADALAARGVPVAVAAPRPASWEQTNPIRHR